MAIKMARTFQYRSGAQERVTACCAEGAPACRFEMDLAK